MTDILRNYLLSGPNARVGQSHRSSARYRQYPYIATSPDNRDTELKHCRNLIRLSVQYDVIATLAIEWLQMAHPHLCCTCRTRAATDEPTPTTDSSSVTGITT